MNYKLEEVFPPITVQILLSPKQQESLELICDYMFSVGLDNSMVLEEALDIGLENYLNHLKYNEPCELRYL